MYWLFLGAFSLGIISGVVRMNIYLKIKRYEHSDQKFEISKIPQKFEVIEKLGNYEIWKRPPKKLQTKEVGGYLYWSTAHFLVKIEGKFVRFLWWGEFESYWKSGREALRSMANPLYD